MGEKDSMKKVLAILYSMILLLVVSCPAAAQHKESISQIQAIDTIVCLDYSQLYQCHKSYYNDTCLSIDLQDAQLLMRVARAEGGPTLEGQLWSMRTIINRLFDGNFGDTISDILTKEGQFEVVSTGYYLDADINANSHVALAMIEGGWDETEGALYWEADTNSETSWHKRNLHYIQTVEGNRYYK